MTHTFQAIPKFGKYNTCNQCNKHRNISNINNNVTRLFQISTNTDTSSSTGADDNNEADRIDQMHKDALEIIQAGISAVNPYTAVASHFQYQHETNTLRVSSSSVKELKYDNYDRIALVSFGKASVPMALAVCDQFTSLNDKQVFQGGHVIAKDHHATPGQIKQLQNFGVQVHEASHPVPDERGVQASYDILEYVRMLSNNQKEKTLLVCCISGGGSALFCTPRHPLTLKDMADTNQCLLASGMSIEKMNVIRKRLEEGKGGGLAVAAFPCSVVTLVLSDIISDPLDLIASGPTVPDDQSCWENVIRLVEEYGLRDKLPKNVVELLQSGYDSREDSSIKDLKDTPKSWTHPEIFLPLPTSPNKQALSETILVGNNVMAVSAAALEASRLGYHTRTLGSRIIGEAADIAKLFTALAHQLAIQRTQENVPSFQIAPLPAAIVCGGETTVTLPDNHDINVGKGGRNQEIGLVAALELKNLGLHNVIISSVGTDGTDGPTDAAGAIVDASTIDRIEGTASTTGEEALRRHDAYNFLDDTALVKTGPTGTNVADIAVILVHE